MSAIWTMIPDSVKQGLLILVALALVVLGFKGWLAAHDAAVRSEARSGYVLESTLAASEALRIKAENDAKFNAAAADAARKQADNSAIALQQSKEKYDADVKADTGDGDPVVTSNDLDWLSKH